MIADVRAATPGPEPRRRGPTVRGGLAILGQPGGPKRHSGHNFHSDRRTIERDHRRDVVHKDAGYEVIRFTGRQRDDEPLYVVAVIARAHDRLSRTRG